MRKICIRCTINKELEDFYLHKRMADGHLNVCKECVKKMVRNRSRSERGRELDRKRNQTKKRKAKLIEYQRKRRAKLQKEYKARGVVSTAIRKGTLIKGICEICGEVKVEAHHEDYNKPLEVKWLCGTHHRALHDQFKRID